MAASGASLMRTIQWSVIGIRAWESLSVAVVEGGLLPTWTVGLPSGLSLTRRPPTTSPNASHKPTLTLVLLWLLDRKSEH